MNWKRLTSTTGAAGLIVNLDNVAYVAPAPHGATLHFDFADDRGKPFTLAVKEKPADICGAGAGHGSASEGAGAFTGISRRAPELPIGSIVTARSIGVWTAGRRWSSRTYNLGNRAPWRTQ
jgi:hypothetical protein